LPPPAREVWAAASACAISCSAHEAVFASVAARWSGGLPDAARSAEVDYPHRAK
jgi:hypothetical protein